MTDVTEIYSFEPIAPAELVDDVLQNFRQPLSEREFNGRSRHSGRSAADQGRPHRDDAGARQPRRQCHPLLARSEHFIRVSARREDEHVIIEVQDRGMGIAADELSLVRRKFARGKLARADGSGLGLAIVSRIVARSQRHVGARKRIWAQARRQRYIYPSREIDMVAERILIVEDDPTLRRVLRDNLIFEGYRVEAVADGKSAISYVRASAPDLVVLDLTLPDFDGLDLCPVLRQSGKVPIIILSARGQKTDKLKGLKLGADDYITKPFDLQELLARINAVLRRSHPALERLLIGKLVIDFRTQRASCDQAPVHLTHREFELLRYLAERREKVVHREELLREVWGYMDTNVTTRSVDHAIVRLRKKIEPDPHHPEFIRTVHGDGYCLSAAQVEN